MKGKVPVSRGFIEALLDRVNGLDYGVQVGGHGLDPEIQRTRNKALIGFLYLSARRISEVVGFSGPSLAKRPPVMLPGIMLEDIRYDTQAGRPVMIISCRILKKAKPEFGDVVIDLKEEPFIGWIRRWIKYQTGAGENKLFPLARSRVYQILKQIDPAIVGPHWFRHARCSHLVSEGGLDAYQLTERVGFWADIGPSVAYVHGSVDVYLDAAEKARKSRSNG
jgi:hypothetical protein